MGNNGVVSRIESVETDLESMIDDVRRLVTIESPSRDLDALRRCADELASIMHERLGSAPSIVESVNEIGRAHV